MSSLDKPTLLVIRGIPGSGKSTIAFSLVDSGLYQDYFEADMYFTGPDGYKYDRSKMKEAHEWCFNEVVKSLELGRSTIVANTHTQGWMYQKYIDLAEKMGYNIQVMVLSSSYKDVHNVPEETVKRMKKELAESLIEESTQYLLTGE